MDRAEMIVRLALMDGFIDQRQAASILTDYREAAGTGQPMPPTEEWASVSGWITPEMAGMLQSQMNRSTFKCACGWEGPGSGGTVAKGGNATICPGCQTGELQIITPAPAHTVSFTPPPPSGRMDAVVDPAVSRPNPTRSDEEVSLLGASGTDSDDEVSLLPREALASRSGRSRVPGVGSSRPGGIRDSWAGSGTGVGPGTGVPGHLNVENLRPGTMIDDWRIESRVGEGAVGIVYRARDIQLERPVAIKVLNADLLANSMQIERFRQEARVLAQLEHPNILAIYRLGSVGARPYIVMQWIEGESLAARIRRQMRTPALVVELDLLLQAARGLQAAHEKRIVHRDVKPDNLMITKDGVVKVADFGLAQHADSSQVLSRAGSFIGTPAYASPEQIEGQSDVDLRADIYSLGITAFELATGRLPWQVDSLVDLLYHQKKSPLPLASDLNPDIPPGFDDLLIAMCAKQPNARVQDMHEVVEQLELLSDEAAEMTSGRTGRTRTRMQVAEENGERVMYVSHDTGSRRRARVRDDENESGEHGGLTGVFQMPELYPAARPDFHAASVFEGHADESLEQAIGEVGQPLGDSDAAMLELRPESVRDSERMREEFKAILMGTADSSGTRSAVPADAGASGREMAGVEGPSEAGSKLTRVKASEISKRLDSLETGGTSGGTDDSGRQKEVRLTQSSLYRNAPRGPKFSIFDPKVLFWIVIAGALVAAGLAKSGVIDLPIDFLQP